MTRCEITEQKDFSSPVVQCSNTAVGTITVCSVEELVGSCICTECQKTLTKEGIKFELTFEISEDDDLYPEEHE